jgi:NAD-dependent DNA ligase
MNIVFTGTAMVDGEHYDRKRLTKTAELYGHHVQKAVDWSTDLLVVGNEVRETVKKRNAIKRKKHIVTIEQFLQMLFTQ